MANPDPFLAHQKIAQDVNTSIRERIRTHCDKEFTTLEAARACHYQARGCRQNFGRAYDRVRRALHEMSVSHQDGIVSVNGNHIWRQT